MVATPHTKDYYAILEVDQSASLEEITKSYKKWALKLHPDRNFRQDTKEVFQELQQAYEVLKDERQRAEYDDIYPSIAKGYHRSYPVSQSDSNTKSTSDEDTNDNDELLLQKLCKAKEDRLDQWCTRKAVLAARIRKLPEIINRLQADVAEMNELLSEYEAYHESNLYKKFMALGETKRMKEWKESKLDRTKANRLQKQRTLKEKENELEQSNDELKLAEDEFIRADEHDDTEIEKLEEDMFRKKVFEQREFWKQSRKAREQEAMQKQYQEDADRESRRQEKAERRRQEELERQRKAEQAEQQRESEEAERQRRDAEEAERQREAEDAERQRRDAQKTERQRRDAKKPESEPQLRRNYNRFGTKHEMAMGIYDIITLTELLGTPIRHECSAGGICVAGIFKSVRICEECSGTYRNYLHCTLCELHVCLRCNQGFWAYES